MCLEQVQEAQEPEVLCVQAAAGWMLAVGPLKACRGQLASCLVQRCGGVDRVELVSVNQNDVQDHCSVPAVSWCDLLQLRQCESLSSGST